MGKGPGHVFVAHGDLLRLSCDAVLVPTDGSGHVPDYWARWSLGEVVRGKLRPDSRVSDAHRLSEQTIRYVVTGRNHRDRPDDDISWLAGGVREGLARAVEDCRDIKAANHGRDRHLIGMPLFGIGAGGYDRNRSQAISAVLDEAHHAAEVSGLDIAVICRSRADYTAVQSQRKSTYWNGPLPDDLASDADDLGRKVRDGGVALFLGAGVSRAAGLPDWYQLLDEIATTRDVGSPAFRNALNDDPARAASILKSEIGDEFTTELKQRLQADRYAIAHALLASLRVGEVVTTNVDSLYEEAATATLDTDLAVLPWGRMPGHPPWLLKLHGDIAHGDIVFTAEDFDEHSRTGRPLGALVQALLMTRHLVFVGYSLRDKDFVRLAEEVAALLRKSDARYTEVGTVLAVEPGNGTSNGWEQDLRMLLVGDDNPDVSASDARALEVFLDRVAWRSANVEASWLLDERYRTFLDEDEAGVVDVLTSLHVPEKARWDALRNVLRNYGRPDANQ